MPAKTMQSKKQTSIETQVAVAAASAAVVVQPVTAVQENTKSKGKKAQVEAPVVAPVVAPVAAPVVVEAAKAAKGKTAKGKTAVVESEVVKSEPATVTAVTAPVVAAVIEGGAKVTKAKAKGKAVVADAAKGKAVSAPKAKEVKPKATKSAKGTKVTKVTKATKATKATKTSKAAKGVSTETSTVTAGEENSEELDNGKRSFKAMLPGSDKFEGRYTGLTPYQAANKALSKYYREASETKPTTEITFSIRESTRGSKRTVYTYNGRREKLAQPVEYTINGKDGARTVTKEYKNRLTKVKKAEAAAPAPTVSASA